jgi:hypothetical protein
MSDESDVAQAKVFHQLLLAEAESLTDVIEAIEETGVNGHRHRRTTARSLTLRAELREIHRHLAKLRERFPELAGSHPGPRR